MELDSSTATPTLSSPIAVDDVINAAESTAVALLGTAEPGSGITLTVDDGVSAPIVMTATADAGGNWSFSGGSAVDVSALVDGSLSISVVSVDAAGNSGSITPQNVTLETSIPSLSISVVAGDDIINAAEDDVDLTISGTTTSIEDAQVVTLVLNGQSYNATVTSSSWTLSVAMADVQVLDTLETVTADVSTLAGVAATQATRDISRDQVPPAQPTVTVLTTNATTPVLSGTATVGSGETLSVTVGVDTYTVGDGNLVLVGTTWTLTVPVANALSEGVYDVMVSITDAAGNTTTDASVVDLTIDTSAPAAPTLAPDMLAADDSGVLDNDNVTNIAAPEFSSTLGVTGAGLVVELLADGVITGSGTAASDGSFSITSAGLNDGNPIITYRSIDSAGNVSESSPALNVTIDTTTPEPVLDTPVMGNNYINISEANTVLLSGTAESNASVLVSLEDIGATQVSTTVSADGSGQWSLLGDELDVSALQSGGLIVGVEVTDKAGNTSSLPITYVELDVEAPEPPQVSSLVTSVTTPSMSGYVNLPIGASLTVLVNSVEYTLNDGNLSWNGADAWALTIPVGNELPDGTFDVVATVTDEAGNPASDSTSNELTIDTTPPAEPTVEQISTNNINPVINGTAVIGVGESLDVTLNFVTYVAGDGNLVLSGDSWILTTPSGNDLVEGVYEVIATTSDVAGNATSDSSSNELIIDLTAPVTPLVTQQSTNSSTPLLTGSATLATGETLSVQIDLLTYMLGDGYLALNANVWTLAIPLSNALGDATYDVIVSVQDEAGNLATDVSSTDLTIDTTAPNNPTIALDLLAADDSGTSSSDDLTNITVVSVSVPAGTATTGDTVSLLHEGAAVDSTTVIADGSFSFTAVSLIEGSQSLSYTVSDAVGNTSASAPTLTVELDTSTATPTLSSPIAVDDVINAAESTAVALLGTAEPGSGITLTVDDGVSTPIVVSATTDAGGNWSFSGASAVDVSALVDGSLSISVVSVDAAGNSGSITPQNVTLETSIPSLSISVVAGDDIINGIEDDSDLAISGTSTDLSDGTVVSVLVDAQSYNATVLSNQWSITVPAAQIPLLSSQFTISADATDAQGDAASTASREVDYDAIAPVVSLSVVAGDNAINASEDDAVMIISGTSVGLEDGQSVEIGLNGQLYAAGVTADAWTVSVPVVDVQNLQTIQTLTANAEDVAGNSAVEVQLTLSYDPVVPVMSINVPALATAANAGVYQVSGVCTVDEGDVLVSIAGATPGSQSVSCTAGSSWQATVDVSGIADGTAVISVNANQTDAAGNTGTATPVTANKDTSTPSISIDVIAGDDIINAAEDDVDLTISGTSTSIEDGQQVSVIVGGQTYNGVVASDSWSALVPASELQDLNLTETVTADVSTLAGVAAPQASRDFTRDSTAPTAPTVQALLTNQPTPTVVGTAVLQSGESLLVSINGTSYSVGDGNLTIDGFGNWILTLPVGDELVDAIYDVQVVVTDPAGNTAVIAGSGALTVDSTPPDAPLNAPDLVALSDSGSSNLDDITNQNTPTFDVLVSGVSPGKEYIAYADAAEIANGVVAVDGSISFTATAMLDGSYTISYKFVDDAGNSSSSSPELTVVIDTLISTPTVVIPLMGDDLINIAEANVVHLEGTAESNAIVNVTIEDLNTLQETISITTNTFGDWTLSGNELDVSLLVSGSLSVDIVATDTAGNVASVPMFSVELDLQSPEPPTVVTLASTLTIPVLAGVAVLEPFSVLTVDVNTVQYTLGDGNLSWDGTETWTLVVPAGNEIADGVYDVTASISDLAGNVSSDLSSGELTIDTLAPIEPTVIPLSSNSTTPTLSGTATLAVGETLTVVIGSITYTVGDGYLVFDGSIWTLSIPAPNALLESVHNITVTVTDSAGNATTETSVGELVVDLTPPSVPTVLSIISNLDTPTLSGTALLNPDESLSVTVDSVTYTTGDGNLSITGSDWTLAIPAGAELADATYDVVAISTDAAGNTTLDTSINELSIDTIAPSQPVVQALATSNSTPVLSGTAVVAADESLRIFVNAVFYAPGDGKLLLTGSDWNLSIPAVDALADNTYSVTAIVVDVAGNTAIDSTSDELVIDSVAPTAPVVDTSISNSATPTLTGFAVLDTGEFLTVVVDLVTYTISNGLSVFPDDTWALIIPSGSELADGLYDIDSTVSDAAGNTASDSTDAELTIDTVSPAIPGITVVITNSSTPVLTGTAVVGLTETLTVAVNGVTYTVGDGHLVDHGDETWTLTIPVINALGDGTYDVTVTVTDIAGNSSSETSSGELNVDTIAPTDPLLAPDMLVSDDTGTSNSDNITSRTAVTFTIPAGTASVGAIATLFDATTDIGSQVVASDGSFSIAGSALLDGSHAITYTLTDGAGNSSNSSPALIIVVDTVAPVLTIDSPIATDNVINALEATTLSITGNGEVDNLIDLEFADGLSNTSASGLVDGSGEWQVAGINLGILSDGAVNVQAVATDIAGNSSSAATASIQLLTALPVQPAVNFLVTNNPAPILSGFALLDIGETLQIMLADEIYLTGDGNLLHDAEDSWVLTLPPAHSLSDGAYDVVVQITDSVGNVAVDPTSDELVVDTVSPAVPAVNLLISNVATPVLTGQATIALGESLNVVVNSVVYAAGDGDLVALGDDTWELLVPVDQALGDGTYDVQVLITDAASNSSVDSSLNELRIDTIAPSIQITSTGDQGDGIIDDVEALNAVFAGSTVGADVGDVIMLSINGAGASIDVTTAVQSANSWSAPPVDLSSMIDGTITVTATVVDTAGNSSVVTTATVELNITPPQLTAAITTPGYDTTPTLAGSTDQPDGETIDIGDGEGTTFCAAVVSANSWSCTFALELGEGSYTLIASTVDLVGHFTDVSLNLEIGGDVDSDADGISDFIEGTGDNDNDGVPDFLDSDSDNDGLPDEVESEADDDLDGVPAYLDLDSDNDGILDAAEGDADADGDGVPNYLDLDSDNDGASDLIEAGVSSEFDADADGRVDGTAGINGIPDAVEVLPDTGVVDYNVDGEADLPRDTDLDTVADYLDLDSDNDGVIDAIENATGDSDGDGLVDSVDPDSDNDGIADIVESGGSDSDADAQVDNFTDADGDGLHDELAGTDADEPDTDADGLVNRIDTDSDNDGIADGLEGSNDTDADGIPDYLDLDSDDDGISDAIEGGDDIDGDGVPNYLDLDSDGDGDADSDEGDFDSDFDGVPDFIDINNDGGVAADGDLDGDGIVNAEDNDIDGDGLTNLQEGTEDSDGDGIPNLLDFDSDGDGIVDLFEGAGDADGDGIENFLDLDSDGDSLLDAIEGRGDPDGDGLGNYLDTDSDGDGLPDAVESAVDTDADGIPDYLDLDSDGDTTPDSIEGLTDANGNGVPDFQEFGQIVDSDGDGLTDIQEGNADTDGDGIPDFLDVDADNDGIPDSSEGANDSDADGIPNYLDLDADGDQIPDAVELLIDSDGDSIPNYLDTDSDGDSLADSLETSFDTDADGTINALDLDSDNDGIADRLETGNDNDGDGIYNAVDIDSDNDGLLDIDEGLATARQLLLNTDSNFFPAEDALSLISRIDSQGNEFTGLLLDNNQNGFDDRIETSESLPRDGDGDLVPDYLDIDSDNDSITDLIEADGIDLNSDGRIDGFSDQNGNGYDDALEASPLQPVDTDGDGFLDIHDSDSDQDGLPDLVEVLGQDQNGDGFVDDFVDTDGDGLSDLILAVPAVLVDSDNDQIANFRELDSDDDGLSDLSEIGGVDVDGDGRVDTLADSDGDGIPDVVDVDQTGGSDADNDGLDDTADVDFTAGPDTDRDGIIDARDPDADGNGMADITQPILASALPDSNGDNVPDYQQAIRQGKVQTGVFGNGAGCAVSTVSKRGSDPVLPLLVLIAVLILLRRSAGFIRLIVVPALLISTLSGCGVLGGSRSDGEDLAAYDPDSEFQRRFYAGLGVGVSSLNPVTDETELTVSGTGGAAVHFHAGLDVSPRIAAELHLGSLGEATLEPEGSIGYSVVGASALFYSASDRATLAMRQGFMGYLRGGLGALSTSATDVEIEQLNTLHFLLGFGFEYGFASGLGIRGELLSYDGDARAGQVALLYRFGSTSEPGEVDKPVQAPPVRQNVPKTKPKPKPKPEPKPEPKPVQKPVPKTAPIVITKPKVVPVPQPAIDTDGDGVVDDRDQCAGTAAGTPVNAKGCAYFDGVLEGVNFESGSDRLLPGAKQILNEAASKLLQFPAIRVQLAAHTDNTGSVETNNDLSKQRVLAVARFLVGRGIAANRLAARAYGASRPISSNDTEQGRALNRRVEMTVINSN